MFKFSSCWCSIGLGFKLHVAHAFVKPNNYKFIHVQCLVSLQHIGSKELNIVFIKTRCLISCLGYLFKLALLELLLFTYSNENEN
jgi:hypothetical protein